MYSNAANIRQSLLIRQGHGKIGVFGVLTWSSLQISSKNTTQTKAEVEVRKKKANTTHTFFCCDDT